MSEKEKIAIDCMIMGIFIGIGIGYLIGIWVVHYG